MKAGAVDFLTKPVQSERCSAPLITPGAGGAGGQEFC
jgi:hypothetical protein